ncbi:MAG: hypothetical protein IMZ71_00720 [Chloroflexi bacterium]|nr:hypothetical protein [Chloroflexota bacterium]
MFWTIRRFVLDIPSKVRSLCFRLSHGFPYEDTWALDTAMAKWLAPRLEWFAENHVGYPGLFEEATAYDGEADDLWTGILFKMADGFERMASENLDCYAGEFSYEDECLDLFHSYFFHLWD